MKTIRFTSVLLLSITSINALIAGYALISDPSGSILKINMDLLKYSPFSDFMIPGIVLFTIIGLFSLAAVLSIVFKFKMMPYFVMVQGIFISGWIISQIIFLRSFNLLHFTFLVVGVLLLFLGRKMNLLRNIIILDPSEQFDL